MFSMILIYEDGTQLTKDLNTNDRAWAECLTEHAFVGLDQEPRPRLIALYQGDRKIMEATVDELDVMLE